MRRFKEKELMNAIKDNEKRGYELIRQFNIPHYSDRGAKVRYTYYAEMKRIE